MRHANLSFFIPHMGCPHRCSFCDQNTISGAGHCVTPEEVKTLCAETAAHWKQTGRQGEIAFFGGSFTAIPRPLMLSLLQAAAPFVDGEVVTGIRCSTRPDCISREILDILREYSVTAVELGVQSMNDHVLLKNGRGHTAQDVIDASALIHEYGMELGHQMMPGLAGEGTEEAKKTARELVKLFPATVRVYPTLVLAGTQLARWYEEGSYQPLELAETVRLCAWLLDFFEQHGVRVIRLGLHASQDVENRLLAGPYHPALRELCDAQRLLERMQEALRGRNKGPWDIFVNPRQISQATGQKRHNLAVLKEQGYEVKIRPDESLLPFTLRLSPAG